MAANIQHYIMTWFLLHDYSFEVRNASLHAIEKGRLIFVKYLFFELAFAVVLSCQAQRSCLSAGLVLYVVSGRVDKFKFLGVHEAIWWTEWGVYLSYKFLVESAQTSAVYSDSRLLHLFFPALEDFSDFSESYPVNLSIFISAR